MNILAEGTTPANKATQANLKTWIARAGITYTATLDSVDPQPGMETFFSVPRDQFILVDLKTMTLIEIIDADPNTAIAEIESMLPPVDGGSG
jgi:hypothetical protein